MIAITTSNSMSVNARDLADGTSPIILLRGGLRWESHLAVCPGGVTRKVFDVNAPSVRLSGQHHLLQPQTLFPKSEGLGLPIDVGRSRARFKVNHEVFGAEDHARFGQDCAELRTFHQGNPNKLHLAFSVIAKEGQHRLRFAASFQFQLTSDKRRHARFAVFRAQDRRQLATFAIK